MDDTSFEMAEKMREMIQMKLPEERLKMGCSMYETSKLLITRAILKENPHISKTGLRRELFLRFYANDFDSSERQKILDHLDRCA